MSIRKVALAVLAGSYLILWIGGVGSHLLYGRTPDGATWAAPAFLGLAGVLVLSALDRADRATWLAVGILGFAVEAIGVHSGFPFGRYKYTDVLQPQIIGVPLVMAAAWIVVAAYVNAMLTGFRLPTQLAAVIAGVWMTAIDLVIDPLAAGRLNYWRWIDTGSYYGIPLQNFLGWFLVSWLIFSLFKFLPAKSRLASQYASAMGLSILLFFTFIALAHYQVWIAGIGCGLCLVHLAIAHWQKIAGSHWLSESKEGCRLRG